MSDDAVLAHELLGRFQGLMELLKLFDDDHRKDVIKEMRELLDNAEGL